LEHFFRQLLIFEEFRQRFIQHVVSPLGVFKQQLLFSVIKVPDRDRVLVCLNPLRDGNNVLIQLPLGPSLPLIELPFLLLDWKLGVVWCRLDFLDALCDSGRDVL
jgi:hypothetical protein